MQENRHRTAALSSLFVLLLLAAASRVTAQECPESCICAGSLLYCRGVGIPSNLHTSLSGQVTRMIVVESDIVYLSPSHLSNFPILDDLALVDCNIQVISSNVFRNSTRLKSISLNTNQLIELPPDVFRGLTRLNKLDLSNNKLRMLDKHIFDGLTNLQTLKLANNELVEVPFIAMKSLTSLKKLEMADNQIYCDCKVAWMKNFDALRNGDPVRCSAPPSLASRRVDDLTVEEMNCSAPLVKASRPVVEAYKKELAVELRCEVEGQPPPQMSWFLGGEELRESADYRLCNNGSLLVVEMKSSLSGEYLCRAENLVGSANVTMELRYGGSKVPSIIRGPVDTHAFENDSFTFHCEADHFAEIMLWEKDGYAVDMESSRYVIRGENERTSSLTVLNARREDSGVYHCVAESEAGKVNTSAVVVVTGTVLTCDGLIDLQDVREMRAKVDAAFNATQEELRNRPRTPGSLLRRLKYPNSGIIEHLKAAEIFDQVVAVIRHNLTNRGGGQVTFANGTVPYLSECELNVLQELSGCEEHNRKVNCSDCHHHRYRSYDGTCNNFDHPLWGASEVPFKRLQRPAYEDGIGLPVGWHGRKPSARLVSQRVISTKQVTGHDQYTHMLMQIGQFLDHDIDLAPIIPSDIAFDSDSPGELLRCDDICENNAPCFPILVPANDTRIRRDCLSFTRSSAVCGTGAASLLLSENIGAHREQLNAITSYVDASQVYGSTNEMADRLREYDERGSPTGYLKMGRKMSSGKRLLPFDTDPNSEIDCSTGIHKDRSDCFLSGDIRVNEQVGLISMHTIFFREHNRIVTGLKQVNPHWGGDKLYQEARAILAAEWQHVIYTEYLPKILGEEFLGDYGGYNSSVDATIANGFATAAYRFGHSQIMPFFSRLDSNYDPLPTGPLLLQNAFFAPFRILEEGGIDPLVRGLISTPVKLRVSSQAMNNNLTEALFGQAHEIGLDLASLNIQRGRDHGLPSYGQWRRFCGLPAAATVNDLQNEISDSSVRQRLAEVYNNDPDNIDLFVGGLLEDTLPGSQLGPTFRCIIGDQFRRLRNGDRFFYERGLFTPDQLVQLKHITLSKIICDNADNISMVPVDAFVLQERSEFARCDELPSVDLTYWKECEEECAPVGERSRRSALFKALESTKKYQELNKHLIELEKKTNTCVFNGKRYGNGDSWKLQECIQCSCVNGEVECGAVANCPTAA